MIEKKSKIISIEKDTSVISCDFCGYEILEEKNTGCCGYKPILKCDVCGKHFCEKCGKPRWYDGSGGDHPDSYGCNICHDTYKEYLPFINQLYEDLNRKLDVINNTWKNIAIKRSEEKCMNR